MLILERPLGSEINIGENIRVKVHRVRRNRAWLAVSAPPDIPIWRSECEHWVPTKQQTEEDNPFRVLVVEDDPVHTRLIDRTLAKRGGMATQFAPTCRRAIETIEAWHEAERKPNGLVLLDYELPDHTGDSMIQWLRANQEHRHLPIVVLSGSTNPEVISRCLDAGASAFVCKPGNFDEFRDVVLRTVDFWRHAAGSAVTFPIHQHRSTGTHAQSA